MEAPFLILCSLEKSVSPVFSCHSSSWAMHLSRVMAMADPFSMLDISVMPSFITPPPYLVSHMAIALTPLAMMLYVAVWPGSSVHVAFFIVAIGCVGCSEIGESGDVVFRLLLVVMFEIIVVIVGLARMFNFIHPWDGVVGQAEGCSTLGRTNDPVAQPT